jgi:hypothetical protein
MPPRSAASGAAIIQRRSAFEVPDLDVWLTEGRDRKPRTSHEAFRNRSNGMALALSVDQDRTE